MKFSNGYWLLRDGVQAAHPVEIHDITQAAGELVVHAPTRPIHRRGDLLQGPVATVRFSSPMPDVIGVSLTHFEGAAQAPGVRHRRDAIPRAPRRGVPHHAARWR